MNPRSDVPQEADPETSAAIDILVRRMRDRGEASDETIAREFMDTLRARGWRPPLPRRASTLRRGTPPTAEYLAAKAALFGPQSDAKDGAA